MRTRLLFVALVVSLLAACSGLTGAAPGTKFEAIFTRTNNLFEGSDVRILGVPKGTVVSLRPEKGHVVAVIQMQPEVKLPADVNVAVAPTSLLGERFIQLDPPYTGGPELEDNAVVPLERTSVAVDIDEVLASFEKFLEGLDSGTLAELVDVVTATLEGQGDDLNQLLEQGSETVRVLRRSSDDINTAVSELADLNTVVATRDEEIGTLLGDLSVVMRTIADESPQIVEGVQNLRRLTAELRPLTDEHSDRLVTDLEILATSLSTVDRNLDRVGEVFRGGDRLFRGAGRAFDYEDAMLRLDNEGENLVPLIQRRLIQRLAGVCIRLDIAQCSDPEFFEGELPIIGCIPEIQQCDDSAITLGDAMLAGMQVMPERARDELAEDLRQQRRREKQAQRRAAAQEREERLEAQQQAEDEDEAADRLPLPDPRLDEPAPATGTPSLTDHLSRWLGGE